MHYIFSLIYILLQTYCKMSFFLLPKYVYSVICILMCVRVCVQGRKWSAGSEHYGKAWQRGDVIGCMLDITDKTISKLVLYYISICFVPSFLKHFLSFVYSTLLCCIIYICLICTAIWFILSYAIWFALSYATWFVLCEALFSIHSKANWHMQTHVCTELTCAKMKYSVNVKKGTII